MSNTFSSGCKVSICFTTIFVRPFISEPFFLFDIGSGWYTVALLSLSATRATDGVISITPSGPAAGFVEEDSFNLTCTSDQSVNVTWALPILPNDELDNIQSKVKNQIVQFTNVLLINFVYF